MSNVVVYEMIDSMSGSVTNEFQAGEQRTVKRRYMIGQTLGFNSTVDEIRAYAPEYVTDASGFYWVRRSLEVNGIGNRYFDCTASYETLLPKPGNSSPGSPDPSPGSLAWDTSGNTERIYQALSETKYGDGPDFEEAINVNGNRVEGLDKVVTGMRYSETWMFPAQSSFDAFFVGDIHSLTGTVNSLQFRAFLPGEALFLGARCQWQGDQPFCAITFEFECRKNNPQFYVKGVMQFPKEGWEYVWIRYQDDVNDDTLVRKPIAAYKNQIYEKRDWAGLRIGGSTVRIGQPPPDPAVPQDGLRPR